MLQQKEPNDYVIGTGKTFTIKEFVNRAAKKIGFKIKWVGRNINEKALDIENNKTIIECKKRYFRPVEVDYLKGNARKAKKLLKRTPKISIDEPNLSWAFALWAFMYAICSHPEYCILILALYDNDPN